MKPASEDKLRTWVQARVNEHGSIQNSKPDDFTQRAWRDLCSHLGVSARTPKARTLDEALARVAELAG